MQLKSNLHTAYKSKKLLSAVILISIFIIGIFVRTYKFDEIPSGLNQDEASIGYEAFSILTTGADRNGYNYPIHLVSWGSGQNALYAYLSIPFVHFLGLNTFSVRIVNVLFSIIGLFLFYFIGKQHFKEKSFLYFSVFLFAINPWSIMSARWGLESNIFPTIILISVFLIIKAIKDNAIYLLPASIFLALSIYSYGTSYFFVPFLIIGILFFSMFKEKVNFPILIISALIFLILSFPIFKFIIINHFGFTPEFNSLISIPKLDSNRTTAIFNLFSTDFFNELIKNFARVSVILFSQTDGNLYNSIPQIGTIYHISIFFVAFGIYNYFTDKSSRTLISNLFIIWLIVALLMSIMIHSNINRLNIIFYPLIFFCSDGVYRLVLFLHKSSQKVIFNTVIIVYSILFITFATTYFGVWQAEKKTTFSKGIGEAIIYANKKYTDETILVSDDNLNMPYIYTCFYNKTTSVKFRKEVVYENQNSEAFRKVRKLGKYIFENSNPNSNYIMIIHNSELIKFKNTSYTKATFDDFSIVKVISK